MFISSKEKLSITLRLTVLEGRVDQLARSLNAVLDSMPKYEDKLAAKAKATANRNAYSRAYYQRKKYEKLVAEQEQKA